MLELFGQWYIKSTFVPIFFAVVGHIKYPANEVAWLSFCSVSIDYANKYSVSFTSSDDFAANIPFDFVPSNSLPHRHSRARPTFSKRENNITYINYKVWFGRMWIHIRRMFNIAHMSLVVVCSYTSGDWTIDRPSRKLYLYYPRSCVHFQTNNFARVVCCGYINSNIGEASGGLFHSFNMIPLVYGRY